MSSSLPNGGLWDEGLVWLIGVVAYLTVGYGTKV